MPETQEEPIKVSQRVNSSDSPTEKQEKPFLQHSNRVVQPWSVIRLVPVTRLRIPTTTNASDHETAFLQLVSCDWRL